MYLGRGVRRSLAAFAALVLVFLYMPLFIVIIQSFNASESAAWPPKRLTTKWWTGVLDQGGWRASLAQSLKVALLATLIALVLGTLTAFAVHRFSFFGRSTVSFLVVLPIALPGIVTGIALRSAFRELDVSLGLLTLVIAHATFCIVVVFNNVIARMRRLTPSIEQASADLGAGAWATFRRVTAIKPD